MTILQSIILAIVEGITEFLPVSSTGHLILTSRLLAIPQSEFLKTFEIVIQLGAILSVVFLYFKTLIKGWSVWWRVLVGFMPAAVIGFLAYDFIKGYLLESSLITLASLLVGGMVLIFLEKVYKPKHAVESIEKMSWKQALGTGLFQAVAMIPGVSRSAATIFGGLFAGLTRKAAVEFSFLVAIPTMAAASGLDLLESNFSFSSSEWVVLAVGFLGSFITAVLAVKLFVRFIEKHSFVPFGVYRILVSLAYYFLVMR